MFNFKCILFFENPVIFLCHTPFRCNTSISIKVMRNSYLVWSYLVWAVRTCRLQSMDIYFSLPLILFAVCLSVSSSTCLSVYVHVCMPVPLFGLLHPCHRTLVKFTISDMHFVLSDIQHIQYVFASRLRCRINLISLYLQRQHRSACYIFGRPPAVCWWVTKQG